MNETICPCDFQTVRARGRRAAAAGTWPCTSQ